jgi:hypothetical protein
MSKRMRWVRHVACMVWFKNAHRILVTTQEGKKPIARRRCKENNNINVNLKHIGREVVV